MRAPREALTQNQIDLNSVPQARMEWKDEAEYQKRYVLMKTPECFWKEMCKGGTPDMEMRPTFMIPQNLTLCHQTLAKPAHKRFGMTPPGKVSARSRSAEAMKVLKRIYPLLPTDPSRLCEWASQKLVGAQMRAKISVDGGTGNTVGRLALAYPKVGSVVSRRITKEEAGAAMKRCGIDLSRAPASVLRPFPILSEDNIDGIKVNVKADSGFPVLAKWTEPGAPEMIMGITEGMWRDLETAYRADRVHGVWNLVRRWEATEPWLVACKGKCKADCYTREKIEEFRMRFYNALPRQVVLLMQTATQVLEEQSRNMLETVEGTSAQGLTLVRGGASDLVDALDVQLMLKGWAYAHVGDDTWCVVRGFGKMYLFSLDCSNFDITQHADNSLAVHEAIRDELARVDPIAAQLWFAYMRERLVVTYKNIPFQWKHGGPSGTPLQSKANDVMMDALCNRIMQHPEKAYNKEELEAYVQELGDEMHFKVRLEDYEVVEGASTLRAALHQVAFLFIGYRFYAEDNKVYVFADIGRSLAQFPYPGLKWTQKRNEHQVNEAMRMGSILMNMGHPPQELKKMFDTMKANVVAEIEKTIAEFGDVSDEKLIWAVQSNPWGAASQPSLVGLREALTRMDDLWSFTQNEQPMEGATTMLTNWSEIVDQQELEETLAAGYRKPERPGRSLKLANLRQLRARAKEVATHPVTLANLGRPAPTAVWGPDKPKRDLTETALRSRGTGKSNRRDTQFYDDESEGYDSGVDRSEDGYDYYLE